MTILKQYTLSLVNVKSGTWSITSLEPLFKKKCIVSNHLVQVQLWQLSENFSMVMDMTMLMYLVLTE